MTGPSVHFYTFPLRCPRHIRTRTATARTPLRAPATPPAAAHDTLDTRAHEPSWAPRRQRRRRPPTSTRSARRVAADSATAEAVVGPQQAHTARPGPVGHSMQCSRHGREVLNPARADGGSGGRLAHRQCSNKRNNAARYAAGSASSDRAAPQLTRGTGQRRPPGAPRSDSIYTPTLRPPTRHSSHPAHQTEGRRRCPGLGVRIPTAMCATLADVRPNPTAQRHVRVKNAALWSKLDGGWPELHYLTGECENRGPGGPRQPADGGQISSVLDNVVKRRVVKTGLLLTRPLDGHSVVALLTTPSGMSPPPEGSRPRNQMREPSPNAASTGYGKAAGNV